MTISSLFGCVLINISLGPETSLVVIWGQPITHEDSISLSSMLQPGCFRMMLHIAGL